MTDRERAIARLVDDVRSATAAGRSINVRAVVAAHGDLMPELQAEIDRLYDARPARPPAAVTVRPVPPPPSGDLAETVARPVDPDATVARPLPQPPPDPAATVARPLPPATPAELPPIATAVDRMDSTVDARDNRPSSAGQTTVTDAGSHDGSDSARIWVQCPGYSIASEISRGGQAVVFLATQLSTGRKVAIKVMRDGPLADDRSMARFQREVEVLAALNHPNIVGILDSGRTADGSQFIVMNYVAGVTLDDYMKRRHRRDPADPGKLLHVFYKVCRAVSEAHVRGIVHRDLKPANIRVDDRGEPHVLDFGLARVSLDRFIRGTDRPLSVSGEFLGSLPWSSPEQAEGDPDKIDVRSDVYSLGVILYQILTGGRFPYEVVGNIRDVLNNILTVDPKPPSAVLSAAAATAARRTQVKGTPAAPPAGVPGVNEAIERVVMKALAKRREARYQSAGEMGKDVANYLLGKPINAKAPPPTPGSAAGPSSAYAVAIAHAGDNGGSKHWQLATLIGGLCVAAVLVMAVALLWPKIGGGGGVGVGGHAGPPAAPVAGKSAPVRSAPLARSSPPPVSTVTPAAPATPTIREDVAAVAPVSPASPEADAAVTASSALAPVADPPAVPPAVSPVPQPPSVPAVGPLPTAVMLLPAVLNGHPDAIARLQFVGPDQVAAVGSAAETTAVTWDLATGRVAIRSDRAANTRFSDNGRWAFSPGQLTEVATGRVVPIGSASANDAARFSADGSRVVVGTPWKDGKDTPARVYRCADGKVLFECPDPTLMFSSFDLSPDGTKVAVCGAGRGLHAWDVDSGREFPHLVWDDATRIGVRFSLDGNRLVAVQANFGYVAVYDVRTGRRLFARPRENYGNTRLFAGTNGFTVAWWQSDTAVMLIAPDPAAPRAGVLDLPSPIVGNPAFSPDGGRVAIASADHVVRLFDTTTYKAVAEWRGHTGAVNTVAFSPDGRLVASAGDDKTVRLWPVPGAPAAAAPPAAAVTDLLQPGSVWVTADARPMTLTIMRRDGESFHGTFALDNGFDRELSGTIKHGIIAWSAADVTARRGGPGGDNTGSIYGDWIAFTFTGPGPAAGEFTLRLKRPAADGPAAAAAATQPAAAWSPLFDGHSLTGWRTLGNAGHHWKIDDNGVLTGDGLDDAAGRQGPSALVTDRAAYGNFHLRVETLCPEGLSAYLVCRAATTPAGELAAYDLSLAGPPGPAPVRLHAGDLAYSGELGGELHELKRTGAVPTAALRDWVTTEVIANGPQLTVIVNGQVVTQYRQLDGRIATAGAVGITCPSHSRIQVRRFEIQELPDAELPGKAAGGGAAATAAADPFAAGSVWTTDGGGWTLTVTARRGATFQATWRANDRDHDVTGTVRNGTVAWSLRDPPTAPAKDVQQFTGTVSGEKISCRKTGPGKTFTPFQLQLQKPK